MEMVHMQKHKKNTQLRGRDYMNENVEKAAVWPEVYYQNISLRAYGKELDTQMAWQRKH
jgi:hypothetical protein